jgi:hypothetical protein
MRPTAPGQRPGTAATPRQARRGVNTPMSSGEIRAAAETYEELGPDYQDAVIESFLDRVGGEIDARVDARITQRQDAQPPTAHRHRPLSSPMTLAIISMILGIPISAIAVAAGKHPAGALGLIVVWIAIAVINVAYAVGYQARFRQSADRR